MYDTIKDCKEILISLNKEGSLNDFDIEYTVNAIVKLARVGYEKQKG